jgi:FHA domain-containing protein/type VI secretion system protein
VLVQSIIIQAQFAYGAPRYWWNDFQVTTCDDAMLLTLRILTYREQPVPGVAVARFADGGGSLGRSPDNTLMLEDPAKYISRVHAKVTCRDGDYFLEDLGSNPSVVNNRPLGKGREIMLGEGDSIVVGDYLIGVGFEAARAGLPPAPDNNPDLPLFEPPAPPAPVQLPPLESERDDTEPPASFNRAMPDALAGASILDIGPGDQLGAPGHDPLGLNLFGAAPVGAPTVGGSESDHVAPERGAFSIPSGFGAAPAAPSPAPAGGMAIPDNWLDDLLSPAAAPPRPPPPPQFQQPELVPVAPSAPPPPLFHQPEPVAVAPAAPPRPAAVRPSTAPGTPAAAAGDSEVLQALLRGLGLPDLKLTRSGPEVAETVGAMLREATAGTIDVLMARAMTKKESRIEMTMMATHANNPLKFFPNADGALSQMLNNSMAGYMPPVQAMASAFDDLRAHELAVIAGMRAALGAVLHRFDPAEIERRLAVPTVFDKMLSANRKAKMWDRLVLLYGEIAREADDDLQRLFGEKFSEAYEQQVVRLRQAKKQAP